VNEWKQVSPEPGLGVGVQIARATSSNRLIIKLIRMKNELTVEILKEKAKPAWRLDRF
jgi:hypothetical protein